MTTYADADVSTIGLRCGPVRLEEFVSGSVAAPRWAIPGVWADGDAGIIGGRPKGGKSTIATELAVSLWSGTPMFGRPEFPVLSRPVPVMYVQQENSTTRVTRDLQHVLAARGLGAIETDEIDGEVIETFHPNPEPSIDPRSDLGGAGVRGIDYHFALRGFEDPPPFVVWSLSGLNLNSPTHRDALRAVVIENGIRYVFLDPLYMLVGAVKVTDGGDELRPTLDWLNTLQPETGAAPILTHHMSDKNGAEFDATSLLGTTFIHGWYEGALLTRRDDAGMFYVKVDALRSMSYTGEITLRGLGVGKWFYSGDAQGATDSVGRSAPKTAAKETNKARAIELRAEHPDWLLTQIADEMGCSERTVRRYFAETDDQEEIGAEVVPT